MKDENTNETRQTARLFTTALTALICLITLLVYVDISYPNPDQARMSVHTMLEFTAHRPFVTRALLPLIAAPVAQLLPGVIVKIGMANPAIGGAMTALDPGYPAQALAVLIVMYACLLAWVAGLRSLMQTLQVNRLSSELGSLAAPLTLLAFGYSKTYDLATMAAFTWCLALLAQDDREDRYLIAFTLASIAKETAVLLIPLYWLTRRRADGLILQIELYIVSRSILFLATVNNPGATAEGHLSEFIAYLGHPHALPSTALALAILLVVFWRWQSKPLFLRQAFLVLAPPLLVLHLLVGFPFEVRVFLEVWPIVMLLMLHPRAYDQPTRSKPVGAGLPAGHVVADPGSGLGQ